MLAAAIITAGATVALAMLAFFQIRASQRQASEAAGAAMLQATIALQAARETREAAERQWQPRVIAHPWFWAIPGDRQGTQGGAVVDGTLYATYYLVNQGSGPAFNVEYGIEIGGNRQRTGIILNMGVGHTVPPVFDIESPTGVAPIVVEVPEPDFGGAAVLYWAQFENLLGERFEVVSYHDPNRQADFRRLT